MFKICDLLISVVDFIFWILAAMASLIVYMIFLVEMLYGCIRYKKNAKNVIIKGSKMYIKEIKTILDKIAD
jgi:hypothetical protein